MKTLVIFLKYLNYACKIKSSTTNLMRQLRYGWLEILFKSANQNILLRFDSFEKQYEQLELVSHRDIQTLENNDKNTRASRSCIHHCFLVFGYPGETLALVVIYYMKVILCKHI